MCKSFDFREFTLRKDRSFIFNIDKLDQDETAEQVQAATALARQNRQEVIPEVDMYNTYAEMARNAGMVVSSALNRQEAAFYPCLQ